MKWVNAKHALEQSIRFSKTQDVKYELTHEWIKLIISFRVLLKAGMAFKEEMKKKQFLNAIEIDQPSQVKRPSLFKTLKRTLTERMSIERESKYRLYDFLTHTQ